MRIDALSLDFFRNYVHLDAAFDPNINVIYGDNAQGKTNLLEAVAYLSGVSHRARYDKELIQFGVDHAFLKSSVFSRERIFLLEAELHRGARRVLRSNGVKLKNSGELSGIFQSVLFCPDDLYLARRRFLDSAICQLRPRYALALAEYRRLHEHKTRILRDSEEKPSLLDTLDESDLASRKVLNEIFLRNVNSQHELARELERSRSELEHGKMEILLRTGSVSQETLQQLTDAVQLKAYNFLLLQENAECSLKEELRTVVVSEQIRKIYGQRFYVQATADDLILVILTQETDEAEELREMCFRTEQLYDALHLTTPLILSDPFEKMEQLSDIYWKARNVADPTQKICYLGNGSAQRGTTVNATNAARLREYLLSGCTEEAVSLLSELFSVDNLDPENFKQDFYTAGGILLNTAERVCCPDIAYLCSYDSKLTARQMLSRLQDCCVEICNHVQFLKHSHNDALQKNILDWLAQNFQNPEINAAMTAEQFKISKKYLSQFLKEQTGKSYTEYVEELRLDHAMQLLRTTDLNITDIAEQCGFSTANTFYKAFRRKYQLSPSAVRKGDN